MLKSINITRIEPVAQGAAFGTTGAYEHLVGTAHGEIDPRHKLNRRIVNIDKAPRNERGLVEYAADFYMLRPVDASRGSGTLVYDVVNRGAKGIFRGFMDAKGRNNEPDDVAAFGNALFLRRGHTLVWSGWDCTASRANGGLAMDPIIATDQGRTIVRTVREEVVSGNRREASNVFRLFHTAATLDPSQARLTVRRLETDERTEIPASGWRYLDEHSFCLLPEGTEPRLGWLYELHYPARDPRVLGVGFAAVRDLVCYLRRDAASPARNVSATLAVGRSQSGRFIRNFIAEGFNQSESGHKVFDGALSHTAGAGGVFFNAEFGEPWRTTTSHNDHLYPEDQFPFSTARVKDPYTGKTGSVFQRNGFDPLFMEVNSASEYWQKGASLVSTDPLGRRDLRLPRGVRAYLIAGAQHGISRGKCANPENPLNPNPALRALAVALEEWVREGREPPASRVPRVRDGTAVPAEDTGFPEIPGMAIARQSNVIAPFGDWVHPRPERDKPYASLVSKVDEDGNEVAGIRLPDVAVPLATYTGWNVYREPYVAGVLGDKCGSIWPLARTRAERMANGDPRLSLEERYRSAADYVRKVQRAADKLVRQRLLLREDAEAFVAAARARMHEVCPPKPRGRRKAIA